MATKIKPGKWQANIEHPYLTDTFGPYITEKKAEAEEKKLHRKLDALFATRLEDVKLHYEGH